MLPIFFLLWVAFNGRLTVEVTLIGVIFSTVVYGFCVKFMGYQPKTDAKIIKGVFHGLRYAAVLVWETMRANAEVSRFVYARNIELRPRIIFFKCDLKTDSAKVALANSITLTPGTITVAVNDDEFCVHCLNEHMGERINDSNFVRLLKKMEEP